MYALRIHDVVVQGAFTWVHILSPIPEDTPVREQRVLATLTVLALCYVLRCVSKFGMAEDLA